MEKKNIIAAYLLKQVIEDNKDLLDMLDSVIDHQKEITKEQMINNLKLIKDILRPLELKIVEAAESLNIELDE